MKRINVLMIPTNKCNMKCIYCFHNEHNSNDLKIDYELLEKAIAIIQKSYTNVNYIWHGGEPLLMGIDFFKKVVELQNKYKKDGDVISNGMQTNLTLMNDEFANFFVENDFAIGSSFDGVLNDKTRGMTNQILSGRDCLIKNGGSCGMIQVVSKITQEALNESYFYCKENKIPFSINMYIDDSSNSDVLGIDVDSYTEKVKALFDLWICDTNDYLRISQFQEIISFILFSEKHTCQYKSCLGHWICVRPDGSLFPCNRFFPQEYCYGNISDYSDIEEAFNSQGFMNILSDAIERREKCKDCEIYSFCEGGCNNNALNENGIKENGGKSCLALKILYKHIGQSISKILEQKNIDNLNPWVVKAVEKYKEDNNNGI